MRKKIILQSLQPIPQLDSQDDQCPLFIIMGVSVLFLHEKGSLVMEGKGLNLLEGGDLASFVGDVGLG